MSDSRMMRARTWPSRSATAAMFGGKGGRGRMLGEPSEEIWKLIPSPLAPHVMATVHPSSILRAPDDAAREREMTLFVSDLKAVARVIRGLA